MRLLKHSIGDQPLNPAYFLTIFILTIFINTISRSAHAMHEDFENENFKRPALVATGAISGIYLISRMNDSPIFFGSIYGITSLFLMNEWYQKEEEFIRLIVPFGVLTLSLINFTILNDEDEYSKHDVFLYNSIGVGAIAMYATVEHARRRGHFSQNSRKPEPKYGLFTPLVSANATGIHWQKHF